MLKKVIENLSLAWYKARSIGTQRESSSVKKWKTQWGGNGHLKKEEKRRKSR